MMTNDMLRRIFAREWLLFLGMFLFGLLATPAIMAAWQPGVDGPYSPRPRGWGRFCLEFVHALARGDRVVWLYVLGPYLIVQAGRSVGWAIGVLRERPPV